jgi:DNA adenine methylase
MDMTNRPTSIKPFLRWAGSKRQLLPVLSSYWSDDFEGYLEPFLGSGSLFFHLHPKRAILGDINSDLIATYEQVKDNLEEVLCELSRMPRDESEYYRVRFMGTSSLTTPQRAARFIYLNHFAFNGLYRTNRRGKFNVPYGGEKSGNFPNRELLAACGRALQGTLLIAGDFEVVLSQARAGDFVYLDPPYSVKARRVFNEYDPSSFGTHDLERLRHWLDKLTKDGVEFLMNYATCAEAELLMDGHTAREVKVRRNIAGFSRSRRIAGEWLISNREALARREV